MSPKAPIICLCGNTQFKNEFLEVAQKLELEGYIVVMPNVFSKVDNIELTKKQLKLLRLIHDQKLDMCDEVCVVTAPGKNGKPYIGNSTKIQVETAQKLGKKIRYFSKKSSILTEKSVLLEKVEKNHNRIRTPLVQSSRTEVAIKYRVEDLTSPLIPGSLMTKILQQLETDDPISEMVLDHLHKKGFIALHRYAINKSSFGEYLKAAEVEQSYRCSSAAAKTIKLEADRKIKAEAIQETLRKKRLKELERAEAIHEKRLKERERAEVRKRAFDNDPKNIAKVKQFQLREKYNLTFVIKKQELPKLMDILHQVEKGVRLSEQQVVWLSTEGNDYFTTKLREGFHRNEAEFYANEFKKNKDPWSAVNASSQYRKCGKANTADSMLNSINIPGLKSLKLKSALYTTHGGVKRDLRNWNEALALADKARLLTPRNFRPYTLLGAVNMEIGQYDVGQSWYKKAVEYGYSEKLMDSELRSIYMRSEKSKQAALSDHLLNIDPVRYSWAKKKNS